MSEQDKMALLAEKQKRLRQRNWALAGALVLFVVLVFIISVVKMGGA